MLETTPSNLPANNYIVSQTIQELLSHLDQNALQELQNRINQPNSENNNNNDDEQNRRNLQLNLIFLFENEFSVAILNQANVNDDLLLEIFKCMNADTRYYVWQYLSEEQRLHFLRETDIQSFEDYIQLLMRTQTYKNFLLAIFGKSPEEILKIWYNLTDAQRAVLFPILPPEIRQKLSRPKEFVKAILSSLGLGLAFLVNVSWLSMNLIISGTAGLGIVFVVDMIGKLCAGFTLNLLGAISGWIISKCYLSQHWIIFLNFIHYKLISNNLDITQISNSTITYPYLLEEFKKLTNNKHNKENNKEHNKKHNKKGEDFYRICLIFKNLKARDQFNCFCLLSEDMQLALLNTDIIKLNVLEHCVKNVKTYRDIKNISKAKLLYKNADKEFGLAYKKIAYYKIQELDSSELPSKHLERLKGVLKFCVPLLVFGFCAIAYPIMPLIISTLPVWGTALAAAVPVIISIGFSIAKFFVEGFKNINWSIHFKYAKGISNCDKSIKLSENQNIEYPKITDKTDIIEFQKERLDELNKSIENHKKENSQKNNNEITEENNAEIPNVTKNSNKILAYVIKGIGIAAGVGGIIAGIIVGALSLLTWPVSTAIMGVGIIIGVLAWLGCNKFLHHSAVNYILMKNNEIPIEIIKKTKIEGNKDLMEMKHNLNFTAFDKERNRYQNNDPNLHYCTQTEIESATAENELGDS